MSETPLYDLSVLQQQTGNDASFMAEMISLFVSQMQEGLKTLTDAQAQQDYSQMYFILHRMKAGIHLFKINSLMEIIKEAEALTKKTEPSERLTQNIEVIRTEMQIVIGQLTKKYLQE